MFLLHLLISPCRSSNPNYKERVVNRKGVEQKVADKDESSKEH